MKMINKIIIKKGIGWFTSLVMETGIVSASSVPTTKTQRRVSASTSAMKTGLYSGKKIINFTELFVNTPQVAKRALTVDASHPSSKVENLYPNFCD